MRLIFSLLFSLVSGGLYIYYLLNREVCVGREPWMQPYKGGIKLSVYLCLQLVVKLAAFVL